MDMYRILENFDAVNSKQTLDEGRVKRGLEDLARQVSKEKFVADAGEYGMSPEEAAEFWANSNDEELNEGLSPKIKKLIDAYRELYPKIAYDANGDELMEPEEAHEETSLQLGVDPSDMDEYFDLEDEELNEERRSEEDWDAQALAQHKAKLAREKNKMDMQRRMQNPEKYAKDNIDEGSPPGGFKAGDRVTVQGQKGPTGSTTGVFVQQIPTQAGQKPFYAFRFDDKKYPGNTYDQVSGNHIFPAEGVAEAAKPDFLDLDGDGNKKEPMKLAARDKNDARGSLQKQMGGSARELTKGLGVKSKANNDMEESALQAYLGKKKYGSEGMKALQQAGRDGASKEKMAKIRASHDKMDEADMEEGNKFAYNVLKAKAAGMKKADLDGDGDMEKVQEVFPGTPEYELRFGKDDASSAFDKKKISTGTVYSRRYRDEPDTDDDAPKSAGRPTGTGRKLGAKGPSVDSKLLKGKGGLKEQDIDIEDRGEYDREGDMALNQVHQIADAARELHAILASDDNLPEWVQSKITKALDYIDTARDYLGAEGEMDREQAVPEAGYSAKAGRAGKDLGKPGKNFSKIAKGAAERYGSKAAGERVAGAVLNKLRHPTEEGQLDELSPKTLGSYVKKSKVDMLKGGLAGMMGASAGDENEKDKAVKKVLKRGFGIDKAVDRMSKQGVEEESADKKDVPFDGPYRTKDDDKDQYGNKIKRAARHAARQGLADMTTAELKAELKRRSQVEEESTGTKDRHAEKAGKKVAKDIEHDEGHKGRDDAKAEKAGKKVTKDIEYDDKKDKEEKVDETTVSGSVATGGDAPKKSKGGMQFGKGVYEGQVAESFEAKLRNVLNEGMSVNVSTDDTGKKSISVNATDADADALGDMLKMAGLFSSEGYSRTCENCHGIHEAGACQADMVEEGDLANSPDEVYADKDYMTQTLSGGLNGPKTTGQTTGAVVNRQDSRQGVMAEAERVKEQAESRLWNLYKKI
jgi:hypothetical protein